MSRGKCRLKVRRISGDRSEEIDDHVVKERPVTILLNGIELGTPMCSPMDLECLAVGFLFAEGLVSGRKDIKTVLADDKDGAVWVETRKTKKIPPDFATKRFITTGCGRGLTFVDAAGGGSESKTRSKFSIQATSIHALMRDFHGRSGLHGKTGGSHSAALCSKKSILVFKEDIGRHSAVDKVLGECVLNDIRMKDRILLTSGRISSEIVVKAMRGRVPIIASKSAPTDLAVRLAEDFGISLVGFARQARMNVYSNDWRILAKPKISSPTS